LREQGHEVRLIPAQYVKPYVKTNKSDYIDAEAIAEAVGRPRMRFVPIKTDDQLDLQSLHRVCLLRCFESGIRSALSAELRSSPQRP
jgi:transposase